MYLGYQKEKIKFYTEKPLDKELYGLDKIEETEKEYVLDGGEYVLKTSEWEEKQLVQEKAAKKQEASNKAYEYINNGALFEFEPNRHFEANDGNISKIGLAAVELILNQDYTSTIEWCTYEDEVLKLDAVQLQKIVQGLKAEQSRVWVELYPAFLTQIEQAETIEAVNAIIIDYGRLNLKLKAKRAKKEAE